MQPTLRAQGHVFFLVFTLVSTIQAQQYQCSCSCCKGQNCQAVLTGYTYAFYCTTGSCLQACSSTYFQCRFIPPYGQVNSQCLAATTLVPSGGSYSCQCNCCNTGSSSCAPILIGYTTAYGCDSGSCSIACATQFPSACVSNQNGQTQGTCLGLTTASTTTVAPWLGNGCSCYCCQSNQKCLPIINVGNASASQCSTLACTQACQNTYSTLCPSSLYMGQTLGQCTNLITGNNQCRCFCCGTNGCLNYNVYTNGDCTSCPSMCLQYTQCVNPYRATQSCYTNSTAVRQVPFGRLKTVIIPLLFSLFPTV